LAVRHELIQRSAGAYRFVHDRVQEAAYSLIPEGQRGRAHLRIGRLLAAHTPPEKREETIFDIVNQLNRGATLITSRDERQQLAELNLFAGKRAKASTAYASALNYLVAGAALLPGNAWEHEHELIFELELHRAECEFLTGALAEAEQRLATLSACVATTVERAKVACLRVDLYTMLDQGSRAIAVGLDYLRHLGIDWSPHPTDEEVFREYERIWSQIGGREIEELIELPSMSDAESLATLDVLTKLSVPTPIDANLYFLVISRAVNLSLERGNSDASCVAYVRLGMVLGARFAAYKAGYRFGQLGYDLVERRGFKRFQARTYMLLGAFVIGWARHVRAGRDLVRRAFDAANQIGDLTYGTYAAYAMNSLLLAAGDPLVEVQREAQQGLVFAQKVRFGLVIDIIATQLGLVRTLRGLTPTFGSFDDERFEELRIERRFAGNPDLARAECWYWVRKLQARFFAGGYPAALEASSRAQSLLWTSPSMCETVEYHYYSALIRATSYDIAAADQREQHIAALTAHHRQLQVWADNCPENFENRAALVGAEIARIEGRTLDAMDLYERAIRSAGANGFVQNEAVANELAARFYAARGFETISHAYLRNARYCYLRWGADGKVRHLDQLYPHLREERPSATSTIGARVEHLDLATVITVSQTVSSEIVLQKLIDTLLRTAIQHAGAEHGLLILSREAEHRTAAEATTCGATVIVHLRDEPVTAAVLPEAVLNQVLRTGESVILDDAAAQPPFAADPYISQRQARSILCLPLTTQAKLVGVLYLENNLTPCVFAPGRIAVLKLLASQAAIALENARLYHELAERETKIRHLVDANIIGIVIYDFEGGIIEANDAFLDMLGYSREELTSGSVRWKDLTPAEWRAASERAVAQVRATGSCELLEKEYIRKDDSRVPVLVAGAAFEQTRNQAISFVLDLTERKRAEAEARESERRFREVQMELAHANRVATIGQLTGSIAHEVNQPIAATLTNAQAALRWLTAQSPDLEEVREALDCIVKDANRAGEVIDRIRALIRKAPRRKDSIDINEAVREVIELTRGETVKNSVSMHTELADGLPLIEGDRVQLQQVVLNLIVNAVQAMGAVGDGTRELLITTARAKPHEVCVAVKDSGPGLATDNLERILDPFYSTKPGGLGMGLSICRSIIEAHEGRLWVTANVPRGAIFHFTVPTQGVAPDS
jgi:PAS domain S-box-containing protein